MEGTNEFCEGDERKRDGKGKRIKVTISMIWRRFVDENIRRKLKEVASKFIEKTLFRNRATG